MNLNHQLVKNAQRWGRVFMQAWTAQNNLAEKVPMRICMSKSKKFRTALLKFPRITDRQNN